MVYGQHKAARESAAAGLASLDGGIYFLVRWGRKQMFDLGGRSSSGSHPVIREDQGGQWLQTYAIVQKLQKSTQLPLLLWCVQGIADSANAAHRQHGFAPVNFASLVPGHVTRIC